MTSLRIQSAGSELAFPQEKESLDIIRKHINGYTAVLFSGGKDSLVALALARKLKPDIRVYFIDDKPHPITYRYIEELKTIWGLNLEVVRQEYVVVGGTEFRFDDITPDTLYARVKQDFPKVNKNLLYWVVMKVFPLQEQIPEDNLITGIRGSEDIWRQFLGVEEERVRKVKLLDKLAEMRACSAKKAKFVHPLLRWEEQDVWAYIKAHNLLYNPLYDMGYRSLGDKFTTQRSETSERGGRNQDLETILYLASVGYLQSTRKLTEGSFVAQKVV